MTFRLHTCIYDGIAAQCQGDTALRRADNDKECPSNGMDIFKMISNKTSWVTG
mgnify:CR=1 FL=1